VLDSCKHGNEPSGPVKGGGVTERIVAYQGLLSKDFVK
jgi:hypothetical protein